ncbi:MAG: immunoglobulin domain-containing protein [Bdellovibrio sp.]|nr:MAG: immunoglobulin domain-containing protein [Bdellovibrio sp.]
MSSFTISVTLSKNKDIQVLWFKDNQLLPLSNTTTLQISNVIPQDSGIYYMEATSSQGETIQSRPIEVIVNSNTTPLSPPSITAEPQS